MTARTLEEIEAISCGVTYMSGYETYVCDPDGPCRKCLKRRVRAAVAIAQEQRAEIARLKARYAWIDSGFGDLDFHREEMRHKGPKRGAKASYYWMRIGVEMVIGTKK